MMKVLRRVAVPVGIVVAVAGLVTLIGVVFFADNKTSGGTNYTVGRGNISAVVRTTGKLEAVRQTRLTFRASDALRRILVKPGDFVPAGALIMELDTTQLEKQLAQAQAQRDIARFNLAAQAEKSQGGANSAATSISELYATARQSELADEQLSQARTAVDNARLYAPYDGTVLSIDASEGDNIGFGQAVATYADLNRLQVRADIDEIDVANVAVGQSVGFSLDAFPGKNFEGRVSLLSPAPTQRQGSTIYAAVVSFTKPADLFLRPGLAANLTITSLTRTSVLLVPNRALETIGLRKYVVRQRPDGTLEKTPVEIGLSNPDQSEIVSGLNEGDRLSVPR